jgi:hypothetical protein
MAHTPPQPVGSISTFNLCMDSSPIDNDVTKTTIGPSEHTLPTQAPDRDLLQDPLPKPNPKKRGRKRKGPLSPAAEALQRKKFLERNRTAASRCREKKKEYISRVKERDVELQRTNVRLKAEKEYLLKEINGITEVLRDCGNCTRRGDVKKLVEGEGWEARRPGGLE